ncbi:hypothetical protein DCAR_0936038 [Daucus carota subsp. sativus]|uniref:PGG domain-containing protein n=1 Tax=Daucus carota subsp. sativus TaxID=79200 RepID=A0AAF0XY64_DAUCS|nr:PREDICTED: ankyrin-3-like [Daucus carota subsp. sativus]WOH16483.1 hypothetical protein DCAR_0936038 [Daucus carota subsp. sativus]
MDSVLYDALIKDNIDVLKEMEHKLSLHDQLTPTKNNVLHLACQHGSVKCLEHILSDDESLLLKTNSRGETGLHLAARQGHYEVVVALFDVAAKSLPPQPICFRKSSLSLKQVLIRTLNKEAETALHLSVQYNHNNLVQLLVTEDPSHSYPQNKHGKTPLCLASLWCYSDIVRTILDNSESLTFEGPHGSTALHGATMNDAGHETVKLLLERNKALIKVPDKHGWTVFHYVALNDLHAIVEDLVRVDKSVGYLVALFERTPLHVAAYEGNVNVMKKLLEYYPDTLDIVDSRGQNILHIAIWQDQKEVIRFILSQGREGITDLLIQRDKKGHTALHLIAKLGCYVEELMNLRTVDWMVQDSKGRTPLDVLNNGLDTLADQVLVRTMLTNAKAKRTGFWFYLKTPKEVQLIQKIKENKKRPPAKNFEKIINTHIIVAALITTVALTAGFAMPGGFNSTEGENQGSPMLLKKASFQTFIIADAIALLLSISSLFLYFYTIMFTDNYKITATMFQASGTLNILSSLAMMLAFITGTLC